MNTTQSKAIPASDRACMKGCEMLRIAHCLDSRLRDGALPPEILRCSCHNVEVKKGGAVTPLPFLSSWRGGTYLLPLPLMARHIVCSNRYPLWRFWLEFNGDIRLYKDVR
jgi:hypothetical protein